MEYNHEKNCTHNSYYGIIQIPIMPKNRDTESAEDIAFPQMNSQSACHIKV